MSKLLSELPVGALVKDTSTKYNGETIIWRVLEHGHTGDPSGSTALEARDIISLKCFDAREPSNSVRNRQNYGNNRYAYSNLLHWLNSNATNWYTAKHQVDQKPDSNSVYSSQNGAINPYDTEAGFLTNFSANLRNALLTVSKTTAKNTITDGGGSESVSSKLFLLSTTEVGLANENDVAEGSIYSYYSGNNNTNNRRKKNLATEAAKGNYDSATSPWYWWLRTPYSSSSSSVRLVSADGSLYYYYAYLGCFGVSPAYCLLSSQKVSDTPDSDGAYTLEWNAAPTITTSNNSLGYQYNPFSVTFTVSDTEGDTLTVTAKIDDGQATILTEGKGSYTYTVDSTTFGDLALGSHTITISASDGVNKQLKTLLSLKLQIPILQ